MGYKEEERLAVSKYNFFLCNFFLLKANKNERVNFLATK